MVKFLIGFIAGIVVGAVGALVFGGGAMMGVGAAAGISTGICSLVQAADQSGVLTPEQIESLLSTAAAELSDRPGVETSQIAGSVEQCAQFMNDLRAGN